MSNLPPLPPSLKAIQHYLKTASEHDKRDPIVAYYCEFSYEILCTFTFTVLAQIIVPSLDFILHDCLMGINVKI